MMNTDYTIALYGDRGVGKTTFMNRADTVLCDFEGIFKVGKSRIRVVDDSQVPKPVCSICDDSHKYISDMIVVMVDLSSPNLEKSVREWKRKFMHVPYPIIFVKNKTDIAPHSYSSSEGVRMSALTDRDFKKVFDYLISKMKKGYRRY